MLYKAVLFDLDGTLTASAEGITKSVQYALMKMGVPAPDLHALEEFVGPPLREQFMKFAGFTSEEAEQAIHYYRERYSAEGYLENQPYPGCIAMLAELKRKGIRLAVASSKPTFYVEKIIKHYKMDLYFDAVVGSELDGTRSKKEEVIEEALARIGFLEARSQVLMVGDRKFDIEGARACGIDSLAVRYGYGTAEELQRAKPDHTVGSTEEIVRYILPRPKVLRVLGALWEILYPILIILAANVAAANIVYMVLVIYTGNMNLDILEYQMPILGLTAVCNIACMVPILKWEQGRIPRAVGSKKFGGLKLRNMAAILIFAAASSQVINYLLTLSGIDRIFTEYSELSATVFDNPLPLLLLVIGVLGPVSEELVFRGLVFTRMKKYMSPGKAILLSSLLFGLYHMNVVQFIYATCLGILMAALYEREKSLLAPMLYHIAANIWSVLFSYFGDTLSGVAGGGVILVLLVVEVVITLTGGYRIFAKYTKKYNENPKQ
ncbi:MAG: HAD hydrolase-like protein [Lachnospiraceae bacterium]